MMSKLNQNILFVLGILMIGGLIAISRTASAEDPQPPVTVETKEVPEGIITVKTELVEPINKADLEGKPVSVQTRVIEVPEGTIIERIETIDPLPAQSANTNQEALTNADSYPTLEVTGIDENTGRILLGVDESRSDSLSRHGLLSWSIFADDLYATCSSGVKFDYTSTTGTSHYTLRWSGGQTSNDATCGGAQCNITVSTNWNAYYTYADTQILVPGQVWGPSDAYKCN